MFKIQDKERLYIYYNALYKHLQTDSERSSSSFIWTASDSDDMLSAALIGERSTGTLQ